MFFLYYMMNPVLIAAAVIPAAVLLFYVYKSDKLEKESPRILVSLIIYGVVSTFLAMITERLGSWILSLFRPSLVLYNVISYFVIVAFSEEGFKYLVLKIRTWKSQEFDCRFDGVVYAVFVSLGFALWENISYVIRYGISTALIRAVTAVPGHACFGVFMGVLYGLAKQYSNYGQQRESKICRILAVIVPALLHGTYDYIATLSVYGSSLIFIAFVIAMFIPAFILIRKTSRRDRYI